MLIGINPLLTGELLWHLDTMGHGDLVAITDAHFPALRGSLHRLVLPGTSAPSVVHAIRSVFPVDSPTGGYLMSSPDDDAAVVAELLHASGSKPGSVVTLERRKFYELAATTFLTIRSAEIRPYGNIILRKGLVT